MEIFFKYSGIYDNQLNDGLAIVSVEKIDEAQLLMSQFWTANGQKIEAVFKEVTGLSFVSKKIPCYLNSGKTFSDPLSLQIEDAKDMIDNLVHELIHVLLEDHRYGQTPQWNRMMEELKDWHFTTRVHVVIHAVHLVVAKKIFPERIDCIKSYSTLPGYIKSWELVAEIGEEEIIKKVFSYNYSESGV